jgi:Holliday junction resolvase
MQILENIKREIEIKKKIKSILKKSRDQILYLLDFAKETKSDWRLVPKLQSLDNFSLGIKQEEELSINRVISKYVYEANVKLCKKYHDEFICNIIKEIDNDINGLKKAIKKAKII